MTWSGKESNQYLCLYSSELLQCIVISSISVCWWADAWLIDCYYSRGFMEWWDSSSAELMQQLHPVYHKWVLFLVTTLNCCVFVCLHLCVYCRIYTHTDGIQITPCGCAQTLHCLHMFIMHAFFSFLFFFLQKFDKSILRLSKFWDKVYLNVYHAVGEMPQKLGLRFISERRLNSQSVTRQRLWLEESISMVTAGFAKGRREVKEACRLFLLPIQPVQKWQYWQDFSEQTRVLLKWLLERQMENLCYHSIQHNYTVS